MKTRILTFLGLLFASVGILSFVQASPAHAAGESYRWVDSVTIEGTGGLYSQFEFGGRPLTTIQFKRVSDGLYTAKGNWSDGSNICRYDLRIEVGTDFIGANVFLTNAEAFPYCEDKANEVDRRIQIKDPNNGPSMGGSEIDYRTVDCAAYYEGGENVDRCLAVKACVVDKGLAVLDCLRAWNTCLVNRTVNGTVLPDKRGECVTFITAGNLAEANKGAPPGGSAGENKTTCVIPGLGWVICPLINILASLTDGAYYIVAAFLDVQPILTTGNTVGLYNAWQVMRNFANVAFVIVFLIIIFSQVTSAGISNYGIKRLLPRLIIAAVLVNVSYWICAIAVDISNIAGNSLKDLFDAIAGQIVIPEVGADSTGVGFVGLAGGILGGALIGLALYVALGALIPVLLGALITIAGVFITLLIRQALIILLIAISPLAFVAFLLPNTENLFTNWRRLFWTLLAMYPIIAVVFGACALASKIVSAGT